MNTIATSTGLSFYIVKALLEESYDTKEENKQIIEKYLSQYGLCVEQWRKDYYSLTGTEVICKRYVDLFDKKTAYIIGYFIACGTHSAKSRFAVYISNKNMYVKDTVQEYVKDVLGPSISWQELKNKEAGVTGNIKSPVIAAFLKDIIAGNKNSRTIPQIYFYADKDVQYELLRGILDGNCYIDQKEHYGTARFNSVNINLTLQVKTLLYFFGVPTTLTYLKRENDGCLLNIPYSPITAKMFNMDNDLGSIRKQWFSSDKLLASRLSSSNLVDYDDYAYEINIAGNTDSLDYIISSSGVISVKVREAETGMETNLLTEDKTSDKEAAIINNAYVDMNDNQNVADEVCNAYITHTVHTMQTTRITHPEADEFKEKKYSLSKSLDTNSGAKNIASEQRSTIFSAEKVDLKPKEKSSFVGSSAYFTKHDLVLTAKGYMPVFKLHFGDVIYDMEENRHYIKEIKKETDVSVPSYKVKFARCDGKHIFYDNVMVMSLPILDKHSSSNAFLDSTPQTEPKYIKSQDIPYGAWTFIPRITDANSLFTTADEGTEHRIDMTKYVPKDLGRTNYQVTETTVVEQLTLGKECPVITPVSMKIVAEETGLSSAQVNAVFHDGKWHGKDSETIIEHYLSKHNMTLDEWRENYYKIHRSENVFEKEVNIYTPDVAYICGYMTGNGHITKPWQNIFTIKNKNEDVAERLIECFQNSFNISVEPPQDINKSASKKLVVYSAVLAGFFEDLLGSPSGSGFSIPDVFFTAPYSVKIAFLEGFFTAAGRINLAKKPGNSRYTNQDYNMICRFKSFLYGLGVPTTIGMDITSGGNTTYNLWIPPNDLFGSLFVYDKPATDEQLKKYCIEDDYIACRVLQISSDNESKDADDNDDCIYSIVLEDSNNGDDDNGYVGIISSAGICCI